MSWLNVQTERRPSLCLSSFSGDLVQCYMAFITVDGDGIEQRLCRSGNRCVATKFQSFRVSELQSALKL